MTAPAFQFYPGDWLSAESVTFLTLEEEGAYIRLLCYCWKEGSIPNDPEKLARLIGKGASTTLTKCLLPLFNQHPGDGSRLVHLRLEVEREKQRKWAEKSAEGGKKSAAKRWKKGVSKTGNGGVTTLTKCLPPFGNSSSSFSSSSTTPIVPNGDERPVQSKLILEAPEPELSREEFAKEIFSLYPRKDGKAEALKAILAAFKSITPIELRVKVEEFARAVATWPEEEKQFVPWCQKWMNKKRWLDDPAAWIRTQSKVTLEQIELQIATHPANPESKRYNPNCTEDQKNHLRALRIQRKDLLNGR